MSEDHSTLPQEGGGLVQELEADVLSSVVRAMQSLSAESRSRVFKAVAAFFDIHGSYEPSHRVATPRQPHSEDVAAKFSESRTPSAKEFLFNKRPQTDVERIACLAYYLTHYMGVSQFKTLELTKLNSTAAQLKFGNAAQAVDNASKAGFLVSADRGQKRISAIGELYVQALPDREAARAAVSAARPRRRRRGSRNGGAEGGGAAEG